jgi:hypothetical protein
MAASQEFVIDFVARGETPGQWRLVLVEEGPWQDMTLALTRLQDRLYNCVEAILDGQIATQFPDSLGAPIVIQVDCYDAPEAEVGAFFTAFSQGIFEIPDYKAALESCRYASAIGFSINFGTPNEET